MRQEVGRDVLGRLLICDKVINSFDIVPNSFSDMTMMNNTNSVKVKLFNIVSHMLPRDARIELSVENYFKDDAYLLVFGGWIPCSFIKNKTILLADRNVVSEIVSRYHNGKKKKDKPDDAFDSIFLNGKFSLDINAFVLEGNKQQTPDNNMINEQVSSVKKPLKLALPNIDITEYPNGNDYYYAFRDMLADDHKKRMDFFQKTAPKLNKQFTEKSRAEAVKTVLRLAEECKLKKSDIAVFLAILRITMVGKKLLRSLFLRILKFTQM